MIGSPGRPDEAVEVVSAEFVVVLDGVVVVVVVVVDVGSRAEVVGEAVVVVVVVVVVDDVVAAVLSGDPQATSSTVNVHAVTHDRRRLNSLLMS
jgi:hypothetical protein